MSVTEEELGVVERIEGGAVRARLERLFEADQAAVWAALTEPGQLAQWLAPGEIALFKGGPAKLDFVDSGIVIDSTVAAVDPPRLLQYSWSGPGEPERPLRWETAEAGDGSTRLTLTVTIPAGEDAAKACAGFVAHLQMLAAALYGAPMKFPFDVYKAAREAYKARLL